MQQVPYETKSMQKDWTPFPPIGFKVRGREGMKLIDAMNLYFDGPDGRDDLMFTRDGIGNCITCRIQVRGSCGGDSIITQSPFLISLRDTPRATNQDRYD